MEVDMSTSPYRTRSSTKRARSPSSPTHYDRPSKRAASGLDTSVPISIPPYQQLVTRFRGKSEDWVSQTQGLRLESPLSDGSGFNTPVSHPEAGVLVDDVMVDEAMGEDNSMCVSPPRPPSTLPETSSVQPFHVPSSLQSSTHPLYHNPGHLRIPSIQIQTATPSPVQMFAQAPLDARPMSTSVPESVFATHGEQASLSTPEVTSPSEERRLYPQAVTATRKQRFTMGPRADCEMCRMRVKGHYMHFD
ncbi:hypothetical protein C8Q80DRAFT_1104343 [Daedaleopsis nitida]|nr:hypothetical protein C8Q80DRAFT_1104343 [Daedaleopsis nitida]